MFLLVTHVVSMMTCVHAVLHKVIVSNIQFAAHCGMSLSFQKYEYGIFMHLYLYKYPASVFEYWIL